MLLMVAYGAAPTAPQVPTVAVARQIWKPVGVSEFGACTRSTSSGRWNAEPARKPRPRREQALEVFSLDLYFP